MAVIALPVLLPVLAGLALGVWRDPPRRALGTAALLVLAATLAGALWAALRQPTAVLAWGGPLQLRLGVAGMARAPVVLVPVVAMAVAAYAVAHEDSDGLTRMVGLLVAFVGAMELLLVAGDLLSLLIAWELVGAVSWGLIAHEWRSGAPARAAHAFNTTRFGDLGLFVAAGAAFAATGSLSFADLPRGAGGAAAAVAAGVLIAAAAKSAQLPFAPWLFSAMAGPTSASALLHSATMVAAGAYLLARLQPTLAGVGWFSPAAVAVGLLTALAGGVVAALQTDAKRLLAASTSAHYGLMIVAVGAGYPAVAIAHLVAHALCKALLFLSAGVATAAAGTGELPRMGLGRVLRPMAWLTAAGTLALAAVPPLGAAWTKEAVVAAATQTAPWVAVLVIAAGGLSAFYAARFQLLAYGPPHDRGHRPPGPPPGAAEHVAIGGLGILGVALGALWLPGGARAVARLTGGAVPAGATWELVGSLLAVAVAGYGAVLLGRRDRLARPATSPRAHATADWFALPAAARLLVATPALTAARAAATFDDAVIDGAVLHVARRARRLATGLGRGDDRVVDAGVRGVAAVARWSARLLDRVAELGVDGTVTGVARLIGAAGRDSSRLQTGQTHTYYAAIAIGAAVLLALTALWSS